MKNVVMEIQGKTAILMNEAGDFISVKNRDYQVGQRLESGPVQKKAPFAKWAVAAAAMVLLLMGGGAYAYYTPYAYVSFDINPSIQMRTNIFDRIIDVTAMNEDAETLLEQIQLANCDMQTAMTRLVDALIKEGYLAPEEAAEIMLTASSQDQDRARVLLQDLTRDMEQEMEQNQVRANIQGECVGSELRIRAQQYGVTPGKLMLAEKYAESTGNPSGVNIQEWLGKSVKEIVNATNKNQQQNNGSAPAGGSQNGNGYAGNDTSGNGYNNGGQSSSGYSGGDTNSNGYNGGDQSGSGYSGGGTSTNGYSGGDQSANSDSGQSANGANAGSDAQNGNVGGAGSNNGDAGGNEVNNGENAQASGSAGSAGNGGGSESSPSTAGQKSGGNQDSGSSAGGKN